jgi:acetyltransferase EpsM
MKIVIVGSGENGVQAFSCLRHQPELTILGFLDDDSRKHGTSVCGLVVLGGLNLLARLRSDAEQLGGLVAIGDNAVRKRLTAVLRGAGVTIISAVHPWALIESPKRIGEGAIIEMGAAIHPEAEIGDGVFLGGGAIVAHHSSVGDFTMIGGGVIFGGRVKVGSETLIGVGASIKPHVTIGSRVTVGVGAAVIADLPDGVVAVGVPAKIVSQANK